MLARIGPWRLPGMATPLAARVAAALWRYTVAQGLITWAVIHLFPRMI